MRRWALLAVALVIVVAGGATTWRTFTPGRDGGPATGASPTGATVPAGFVACDAMLCPATPLCWGGLSANNGQAKPPPRDIDCAQSHYWETFAATALPPDVKSSREDELLLRKDIAAVCSATLLAKRSRDAGTTRDWLIDAWPIEMPGSRLVHCLAKPDGSESSGSAFTSA